jgi:hypothetical protein
MYYRKTPDFNLNDLESHLAGTLKPVTPPSGSAQRLRRRIRLPQRSEIVMRFNNWRSLFIALGGTLSGLLLIITVARALYHLVGRRGS